MASDYSLDLRTQVGPKKPDVPKADVKLQELYRQASDEIQAEIELSLIHI